VDGTSQIVAAIANGHLVYVTDPGGDLSTSGLSSAAQTAIAATRTANGGATPPAAPTVIPVSSYSQTWAANTAYAASTLVTEAGALYLAPSGGAPARSTFTAGDWTLVLAAPSGGGAVSSVAGRTGVVTLTPTDVGLANVDNTADTAKALSTAATTALAAKADLVGGLVPTAQIPALALTTAVPVANQAAMLALTSSQVQPGDLAVRADGAGTFILAAVDPSQLGNWLRLNAPTDAVTTVNGHVGTVVLAASDVSADPAGAAASAQAAAIAASDTAGAASSAQAAAIAASTPALGAPSAWTTGASAIGVNTVDATAGNKTPSLPNPTKVGQLLSVERTDTTYANTVTISGTIRGCCRIGHPDLPIRDNRLRS
jgi:hypothetical protein